MDDPVLVDDLRPSKPPLASVYDDMFESYFNRAAEPPEPSPKASSSSSTPPPVFDKPVFDDDPDAIDPFDAIPLFGAGSGGGDGGGDDGQKDFFGGHGSAVTSEERREPKAVGFDDDLFPGLEGSARSTEPVRDAAELDPEAAGFDYLIPGFDASVKPAPPMEPEEVVPDDGVIPGFGGSTNHHDSARDDPMTRHEPMLSSKMSVSMPEDPFIFLGATPKTEYSSFGLFSDYLDNMGMPAKSESTKVDAPANTSGGFQGSDMFAGFPKAMPSFSFASEKESDTTGRTSVESIYSMRQSNHMPVQQGSTEATANILPEVNVSEPSVIHEAPIVTSFQTLNPFAMDDGLPEKNKYSDMADDVWLTVSDITLVTQPTSAPPPSRPPPPLVKKQPPTESATSKTYPDHNQGYHHSVDSVDTLKSSQIDELEDFFTAKPAKFANEHPRDLNHEGTEQYSSTATANFMGQCDVRDSKGMDQGNFDSVFTSSQHGQEEIDETLEFCAHEMEKMNEGERLENERRQREHDEEQRRAERERIEELEQEREKVRQREQEEQKRHEKEREARQAVEKAIREARERAAIEARMRAESEARRRAERAAVQKAAAEARERAAVEARERAAKSAADSKERATAEARERAARAAAEATEKAAAESQEEAAAEAREKAERAAVEEAAAEAVEKAIREARERAAVEARTRAESEACRRAERAAVHKAAAEARERAALEARERAVKFAAEAKERASEEARERATAEAREKATAESQEKAAAEARAKAERAAVEKAAAEARRRAERAAFERVAAEVRQRAANEARERAAAEARARENQQKTATTQPDLESFFGMPSGSSSVPISQSTTTNPFDIHPQGSSGSGPARTTSSGSASPFMQPSSSNLMDDLSSIFGELGGEREERRKPGLEREQRIMERAAKALAEKNERDLLAQREQEERHRIGETLDFEIKRWAAGKEGNVRALLSTLQYILWPECGWRPVSLTDLITAASVKKEYRKATLCIHPDKVQQKGANLQQRYIAEKVFDLLKEAWNKFNSEELF